ncbi:MAG: P-loop NTPase [Oscillospiraceae bacterium]|jgi:septum site-determining protein MinD|nr:P-loop NTPase [Oscillospiraceae bacterium]
MQTEICAVVSGKGGVGKSTLAFYLADVLAGGKSRSLILDFNVGIRGVDVFFGAAGDIVYDLGDVLEGRCSVYHSALIPCVHNRNYFAMAAPSDLFYHFDFDKLYNLSVELKKDFNYIFIDAPSAISNALISAVSLCDRAIIVTTPDPLSVSAAAKIGKYIVSSDTATSHVLINGVNFNSRTSPLISDFDEIIDAVSHPLIGVVPYDATLYGVLMKGRLLPRNSKLSRAVYSIARRYNKDSVPLVVG